MEVGTLFDMIARILGIGLLVFMVWILVFPGADAQEDVDERDERVSHGRREDEPYRTDRHQSYSLHMPGRGHS